MKDIRPLIPVNVTQEEQSKLVGELLNETQTFVPPQTNITNAKEYLILPSKTYGNYSYPDLSVSTSKLGYNNEIEKVAKKLNLSLSNTATEQTTSKGYIGNIKWKQALDLNSALGGLTLNIRQFADFLNLLKSGKAFYADGSKADKTLLDKILDEILIVRNPWRAEWLDAKFIKNNNQNYIIYHRINNGKLEEITEELEECLMNDKTPGINLDLWLKNATKQGLPNKKVGGGDLYYWYPRENTVARFDAISNWAYLSCDGDPDYSDSGLGVRRAKIRK